jgi:hypothetical protein
MGSWDKETASWEVATAKSRTGYIITYANCPLLWTSKLQTEVTLSSTEAEYVALSTALRQIIPMMALVHEMKRQGIKVIHQVPKVHCRVFEDNSGAIELAKVPKMRPRTKHINCKYHHFRQHVDRGDITVLPIKSEDQPADMLTKALNQETLQKHRMKIMGWDMKGPERECEGTGARSNAHWRGSSEQPLSPNNGSNDTKGKLDHSNSFSAT